MGPTITQVDAFTDRPFAGNPAAVCLLDGPRADDWMQQVAREMNLSETAFLIKREDGFHLRWFTPTVEVDLCGHATLASAHVLWEQHHAPESELLHFHTRSGLLTAQKNGNWIVMDFPATPAEPVARLEALETALAVSATYTGRSRAAYLVEVESEDAVRAIKPDFAALRQLDTGRAIVTSRALGPGYDFVSRYFAPGAGVDEDPVTGSAHCCLGPYWKARLGRDNLVGYQASPRGGIVRTSCHADRVHLSGQAVTVLRGTLL